MKIKNTVLSFVLASLTSGIYSEPLLKTTTTWEGADIVYPKGNAEITSVILKIDAGETTPFHCHPVPTLGYVLKGKVEVETTSGKRIIFSEGESAVEVLGTLHRGRAVDGPVELVVFYAGAESIPTTVLPTDELHSTYCHH